MASPRAPITATTSNTAPLPNTTSTTNNTAQPSSQTQPTSTTQTSQPQAPNPSARGTPHYEKIRRDLRSSVQKRHSLEEKLQKLENNLLLAEKAYLEDNPAGNIIKGFEGYVKHMSGSGGTRRKGGFSDSDRVFSRSGGVGLANGDDSGSGRSTPLRVGGNGGTQTPTSGREQPQTLLREASGSNSNHATPGSTSSGTGNGKGSMSVGGGMVKKSGVKRSATGGGEDSETESAERKKMRTSFGVTGGLSGGRK